MGSLVLAPVLGPSPRARGAPRQEPRHRVSAGTIPACAGSTPPTCSSPTRPGDHPRVRGEHSLASSTTTSAQGPSPRARGAPTPARGWRRGRGTIPACAGSTTAPRTRRRRPWDHPRVRGEHPRFDRSSLGPSGPSPRARGALLLAELPEHAPGTIPACAGSTIQRSRETVGSWDHPRVRGEHSQRPANLPVASSRFSNFFRNRQNGRRAQPQEDHARRIPVGAQHSPADNPSPNFDLWNYGSRDGPVPTRHPSNSSGRYRMGSERV